MSSTNHNGADSRSQVIVRVVDGAWKRQNQGRSIPEGTGREFGRASRR